VKRVAVVVVLLVLLVAVLLPFSLITQTVSAQASSYTIQRVDHEVEVMYSGHVIIRDTIHISGQLTGDFLIGFPYKYGVAVLKGMAYDADNNVFPLSLGVQLTNGTGFYGAKISFSHAAPQVFTVVFILSNSLLTQDANTGVFSLDFPAYPSFVTGVGSCHVDILLPETPTTITITKNDGEVSTTSFVKDNLPAFTYSPAVASFSLTSGSLQIINIKELDRQITISPAGDVAASDSYRITNNLSASLGSLEIGLPLGASSIVVRDEFGRTLTTDLLSSSGSTSMVNVTLVSAIASGASTQLTADYSLSSVSSAQAPYFTLNFNLFPDFDYYVDTATVTFAFPEGARLLSPQLSSIGFSSSLTREIFQETLSISRDGVSKIDYVVPSENVLQIAYGYNPLWLSFRPTLWVWALAIVGCVVVAVWRRPRAPEPLRIAAPEASIVLSPDHVRSFTEAYDDKSRLTSELKTLEARAQKGRIPRRRYKVQKRTLEMRLETISKNIAELKKIFRSAGGNYANLVRQLDVAETELEEAETEIRTIEIRYRKGEFPLETYKKSLAAHERQKEKAEASINGILLRIREEIR
jgi:hypothetical protein